MKSSFSGTNLGLTTFLTTFSTLLFSNVSDATFLKTLFSVVGEASDKDMCLLSSKGGGTEIVKTLLAKNVFTVLFLSLIVKNMFTGNKKKNCWFFFRNRED